MKTTKKTLLTLSKEEMKTFGYQVVDLLVSHFDNLNNQKIVSLADREQMDTLLQESMPLEPTPGKEVLEHVVKNVLSHVDLLTHPKYFSFVPSPSNYVSVMADTIATGYNVFSGGWAHSPAAAELEIVTMNWLLEIFGLPVKTGGGLFTSGGSMANLTALTTARRTKCGQDFSKGIIYLSDQTHSSNIKAIRILGFKKRQVRILPTGTDCKMPIDKLKQEILKDKEQGYQPFCIIATAGTTNTGTVDALEAIAEICNDEDLWMHVDGAYGAAAMLSEKGRNQLKGIEKADSLTVDPHKWFFQPYEIGCLLVKNHKWLSRTFMEKPVYLRDVEGNSSEINFYDHGIQLTRRFRALKFYMSVKTFGLNAFKQAIDYNITLAEEVEAFMLKTQHWEVMLPANLAIINFRYNPIDLSIPEKKIDALNQFISKEVIAAREAVLVTTVLHTKVVLRMCLINPKTTLKDIKEVLRVCEDKANQWLIQCNE